MKRVQSQSSVAVEVRTPSPIPDPPAYQSIPVSISFLGGTGGASGSSTGGSSTSSGSPSNGTGSTRRSGSVSGSVDSSAHSGPVAPVVHPTVPPVAIPVSASASASSSGTISASSSVGSSSASLSTLSRSTKRSSSTGNDLIYERDRFRARLHTLNGSAHFEDEDCGACEVCDEVGRKTTKLTHDDHTDTSSILSSRAASHKEDSGDDNDSGDDDDDDDDDEGHSTPVEGGGESDESAEDSVTPHASPPPPSDSASDGTLQSLHKSSLSPHQPLAPRSDHLEDVPEASEPEPLDTCHHLLDPSISPLHPLSPFYLSLPSVPSLPCGGAGERAGGGAESPVSSPLVPQIKAVSFSQLHQIFAWYFNKPLPPTDTMFPYLHGLHKDNFAQKQFFVYQQQQQYQQQQRQLQRDLHYNAYGGQVLFNEIGKKPENVRFLMTINADHNRKGHASAVKDSFAYQPVLKNNVMLSEILSPIDISRTEMAELIRSLVTKLFPIVGDSDESDTDSDDCSATGSSSAAKLGAPAAAAASTSRMDDEDRDLLVKQLVNDCIRINHLPTFLYLDPDYGVSLRNFHIQVTKSATFSDFIIYRYKQQQHSAAGAAAATATAAEEDDDDLSLSIARVIWLAQRNEAYQNGPFYSSDYNIFIVDGVEDIEDLVDPYKDLFTVRPSNTLPSAFHAANLSASHHRHRYQGPTSFDPSVLTSLAIWDGDYQVKERLETTTMSSATKIFKNVWVGNVWDCHVMLEKIRKDQQHHQQQHQQEHHSHGHGHGHHQHSHHSRSHSHGAGVGSKTITVSLPIPPENYCDPTQSVLLKDLTGFSDPNDILSQLSEPRANWRLFIHCHDNAAFPQLGTLSALLFQFTISPRHGTTNDGDDSESAYHVVDFPPSGSVGLGNCKVENLMAIINLCKVLYLYSSSTSRSSDVPSSLIYCSNGFTESSLIVLCYLMYAKNIRLDQAMLLLHIDYGRPFYIFNSDVQILRKLEPILRKFSPENPTNAGKIAWGELEALSDAEMNEFLLGGGASQNTRRLGYIYNADDDDVDTEETAASSDSDHQEEASEVQSSTGAVSSSVTVSVPLGPQTSQRQQHHQLYHKYIGGSRWVEDVEGSLPSKILPYLYLGSLKHANNPTLLSKLGIKYIISAGEPLDWLNGYKFLANHDVVVERLNNGNIEVFTIYPKRTGEKLTPKREKQLYTSVRTIMKVNNLQDDGIDELSSSLPAVLKFIDEKYEEEKAGGNGKILVHCRVGVSRSATIVISEVMRRLKVNLPRAYLYVRVRRLNIVIQPNLRFMYELFKWEERVKQEERMVLAGTGAGADADAAAMENLREIDWFVMCREIMRLNIPYLS